MIHTGDVLVLLERRFGPRGRKLLPVGQLLKQDQESTILLYKGELCTITDCVVFQEKTYDFLVLPGHLLLRDDARVIRRSCCAAHLVGAGTSLCCKHLLDAEALKKHGGAWRH